MSLVQKIDDQMMQTVQAIISRHGRDAHAIIPILQAIQSTYKYLPEPALRAVCDLTEIRAADIMGVSSFYSQFRHKPVGDHIIQVCTGTACHVKGAERVHDAFRNELHIAKGEDTDASHLYTVQKVACLGCCTLAPVVQIDEVTYGHVQPEKVHDVLKDFSSRDHDASSSSMVVAGHADDIGEIRIGLGSCCVASGSGEVRNALYETLTESGIHTRVKRVGCVGMCHRVPLLELVPADKDQETVLYDKVAPEQVRDIVLKHFRPPSFKQRFLSKTRQWLDTIYDESTSGFTRHGMHVRDPLIQAFLGRQIHIATEHAGYVDPLDLSDYRNRGGFKAVERVLDMDPDQLIGEIIASGLRGRGGAGFPTGKKWQIARQVKDDLKYIVCNGDEGDPGAFMDRMILESYPYRVLEGMIIGALAIGAHKGYLYIRAEYPLAVERVRAAIKKCEQQGLLGENILGSGFSLTLQIMEGAGAFVCGEETALLASIEGKRGMPRFRPPYPAQKGLWNHSTLVNNCETFATVPWIINHGPDSFSSMGTDESKGTKVFSLAGKIARGGLIEVPWASPSVKWLKKSAVGSNTASVSRPCRSAVLQADVCRQNSHIPKSILKI
jgi:NADH-quinone oxidoreductase subunit F